MKAKIRNNKVLNFALDYIVWIFLALFIVMMGIIKPVFFQPKIMTNILQQATVLGVITIAMAMAILLGAINLSVVGTAAFSATVSTTLMVNHGVPWALAIAICVGTGTLVGLINGLFIVKLKAVPLIETLAMNMLLTGAVLAITRGVSITNYPDAYKFVGQGRIGGMPVLPLVLIVMYVLFYFIWQKTTFGRSLFAVGGNEQSAYVAGINVNKVRILSFTIGGAVCGLAGFLLSSYMGAVTTSFGESYEMQSIAAAVIGGVSLTGGVGSIPGILGGALLMTAINVGLQILGIQSYYVPLFSGIMVTLAVLVDALKNNLKS